MTMKRIGKTALIAALLSLGFAASAVAAGCQKESSFEAWLEAVIEQHVSPAERTGTWSHDLGQGREFIYKYTASNTTSNPFSRAIATWIMVETPMVIAPLITAGNRVGGAVDIPTSTASPCFWNSPLSAQKHGTM